MSEQAEHFEAWGIVALFGHKQIAGRISEQTIGGETFIRVDVPTPANAGSASTYYTQLFGKGAIYSMSLTDEAIAREFAKRATARPVSAYDVAQLLRDSAPTLLPRAGGSDPELDDDNDYP